jgi:hypothetical protein
MFVDDPAKSVKLASGLVDRAINDLVTSLRERQDSLATWEDGDGSDTEGLRNVLRSYRSLFEQLEGMSGEFGSGKTKTSALHRMSSSGPHHPAPGVGACPAPTGPARAPGGQGRNAGVPRAVLARAGESR